MKEDGFAEEEFETEDAIATMTTTPSALSPPAQRRRRSSSSTSFIVKERLNKLVQTTARNSWSLVQHLRKRKEEKEEEEEDDNDNEDGREENGEENTTRRQRKKKSAAARRGGNDEELSVPKKLSRYFRMDRRRTLTFLTFLTAFPPTLRTTVDVSGTRILDYVVTTISTVAVLLSMSLYAWEREVYPALKMLLFAAVVVVQLLAENVCVALITHLDENKFVYESLQDNLYQWLHRGCETSRALSALFCGRFPGWTTLHFGAWIILGVLGPTLGGEGREGLIGGMFFKKKNNHHDQGEKKPLSRDERPVHAVSDRSRSNERDEELGEKREGGFVEGKSPNFSNSFSSERSVFGIAARTCATIALARAIRVVSFMLTVLPNPKPGCYNRQFSDAPKHYEDGWHLIKYGSSRIRGSGGCNDLIFSGHGVIYMSGFLCIATHGVSLGSFVVFLAVLHVSCKEALDQTHYGVDMFLAIAVTALSWRECHTVEKWVTGKSKDREGGRKADEVEGGNGRDRKQMSRRAMRAVSFSLPFLIIALVIAGATVFITSDA